MVVVARLDVDDRRDVVLLVTAAAAAAAAAGGPGPRRRRRPRPVEAGRCWTVLGEDGDGDRSAVKRLRRRRRCGGVGDGHLLVGQVAVPGFAGVERRATDADGGVEAGARVAPRRAVAAAAAVAGHATIYRHGPLTVAPLAHTAVPNPHRPPDKTRRSLV